MNKKIYSKIKRTFYDILFSGYKIRIKYDRDNSCIVVYINNKIHGFIEQYGADTICLYNKNWDDVNSFDLYPINAKTNLRHILLRFVERIVLRVDIENTLFGCIK
jgi:hypothetical protein